MKVIVSPTKNGLFATGHSHKTFSPDLVIYNLGHNDLPGNGPQVKTEIPPITRVLTKEESRQHQRKRSSQT